MNSNAGLSSTMFVQPSDLDKLAGYLKEATANESNSHPTEVKRQMGESEMGSRSVNDIAKQALIHGAGKGAVGAVNKRLVAKLLDQMGDKCPPLLKTEAGRSALEVLIPYALMQSLQLPMVSERVPAKDKIERVLEMAMEDATQRGTGKAIDALLEMILPVFEELAEAAKELPDNSLAGLEEDFSKVETRERVAVKAA